MKYSLRALGVLCGLFSFVATGVSAAPQEVVPVEDEAFAGELHSIGADGKVTFRGVGANGAPGAVRAMALDQLVRWGHPVDARPQSIVVLTGGGQIVTAADWSGGAAVRLENERIVVLSDTFGEVRLPRRWVRGVVFAQRKHPTERAGLVEQVRSSGGEQDTVLLTNDDRLSGTLTELARGSLTIDTKAGAAKLPLSRVEAAIFAQTQAAEDSVEAGAEPAKVIVGVRDGSLVYAYAIQVDQERLNVRLGNGLQIEGGSVADVVALQLLGGKFVYLSDLEPADYRHVPYLSIEWPYQRNRNVMGEPLAVGGARYSMGVGMHSASRLTYRLDEKYRRFHSAVAVDDSAGGRGSVTFGVYVLRDGKWSEAYTSGIVRGGDAPQPVSVDVGGAQGLTLTVDYADRGDELDHADWLDARLVKKKD